MQAMKLIAVVELEHVCTNLFLVNSFRDVDAQDYDIRAVEIRKSCSIGDVFVVDIVGGVFFDAG